MELSLSSLGKYIYTIPAAILIIAGREFLRSYLHKANHYDLEYFPLGETDPLAIVTLSFFGISWGGMPSGKFEENQLTIFFSMAWYPLIYLLSLGYYHIKMPADHTYLKLIVTSLNIFLVNMFLLNLIPLPGFDTGSIFPGKNEIIKILRYIFRAGFIFCLLFTPAIIWLESFDNSLLSLTGMK